MIFEKIRKIFYGEIKFTASGGFPELFLEQCSKYGICLFGTVIKEGKLESSIQYKDRKKLYEAGKKSGTDISVITTRGLFHVLYKYRKRVGIPVGILFSVLILSYLFMHIWSIDIKGNENIRTSEIEKALAETGIYVGCSRKNADCSKAEYYLSKNFGDILHVTVNTAGCRVFVDIKQTVKAEEITDENTYTNIVAGKDGEIIKADILKGEGELAPGTPVIKGDMLVNGVITYKDGRVNFVNSKANIIARTKNIITAESPENFGAYKIKKSRDIYSLHIFGLTMPFGIYKKSEIKTETDYFIDGDNIIFPLGLRRKNILIKEPGKTVFTPEMISLVNFSQFAEKSAKLYKTADIREFREDKSSDGIYLYKGTYICEEDIGIKKSFTVEDNLLQQ